MSVLFSWALLAGLILSAPQPHQSSCCPLFVPSQEVLEAAPSQERQEWHEILSLPAAAGIPRCLRFLKSHPGSSLAPFVRYRLAHLYRLSGQSGPFLEWTRKVLAEQPDLPDLWAHSAAYLAEWGEVGEAAAKGEEALRRLRGREKPPSLSSREWESLRDELEARANYALGRVYLFQAAQSDGRMRSLALSKARRHLSRTLKLQPADQSAAFYLGELHLREGDRRAALRYYARATVLGGLIAQTASQRLRELCLQLFGSDQRLEALLEEQRRELEKAALNRPRE